MYKGMSKNRNPHDKLNLEGLLVHSYYIHHKTCNRSCIKSSVITLSDYIVHLIKYRILRRENVIKLPDKEGREAVTATARRCIQHALIGYGRRVK